MMFGYPDHAFRRIMKDAIRWYLSSGKNLMAPILWHTKVGYTKRVLKKVFPFAEENAVQTEVAQPFIFPESMHDRQLLVSQGAS